MTLAWLRRRCRSRGAAFPGHHGGVAATEFALVSPIFLLILVGTIDFGGVLYVEFGLSGAVSAAADYALVNPGGVSATGGAALASQLVSIASSAHAAGWATATIVVNNGPNASGTSAAATSGGTAANADSCYCPTLSGSTMSWGAPLACTASCSGGNPAGKFVTIAASRAYTPIFGSYGLVKNNTLSSASVVQVQ